MKSIKPVAAGLAAIVTLNGAYAEFEPEKAPKPAPDKAPLASLTFISTSSATLDMGYHELRNAVTDDEIRVHRNPSYLKISKDF